MRLIDANALIAPLKEEYKKVKQAFDETSVFKAPNDVALYGALTQEVGAVIGMIEDAPTVDAVPVKHGYWIEEIDPEEDCWNEEVLYCSCCNEPIRVHETDNTYFLPTRRTLKYCPMCGAKMDAERKEE